MGLTVLKICRLVSPAGSRNHGAPVGHTFGSTVSGSIRTGFNGSSHLFGRKVPQTVSGPPRLTSMVYWLAARSDWMRAASWLLLPARYSRSMLKRCLNAAGSFELASGAGGPLTTALPSFWAAATSWSQPAGAAPVWAGAPVAAGGAGALDPQPVSATPSRPTAP